MSKNNKDIKEKAEKHVKPIDTHSIKLVIGKWRLKKRKGGYSSVVKSSSLNMTDRNRFKRLDGLFNYY